MTADEGRSTDRKAPRRRERRGRRRGGGRGWSIWIPRLFILPLVAVGIGLICVTVATAAWAALGVDHPGTLLGARKMWKVYDVRFGYRMEGVERTGSTRVSHEEFARLGLSEADAGAEAAGNAAVPLRSVGLGPYRYAEVRVPGKTGWELAGMMLFFSVIWNGGMAVFVYVLYVKPLRQCRRMKSGAQE